MSPEEVVAAHPEGCAIALLKGGDELCAKPATGLLRDTCDHGHGSEHPLCFLHGIECLAVLRSSMVTCRECAEGENPHDCLMEFVSADGDLTDVEVEVVNISGHQSGEEPHHCLEHMGAEELRTFLLAFAGMTGAFTSNVSAFFDKPELQEEREMSLRLQNTELNMLAETVHDKLCPDAH